MLFLASPCCFRANKNIFRTMSSIQQLLPLFEQFKSSVNQNDIQSANKALVDLKV